jgi:hypothetical protein
LGNWKKGSGRDAYEGGKRKETPTFDWPNESFWCAKCKNMGLLPVAYLSKKRTRVLSGVAACSCEWGEARQKQWGRKIASYYDYPSSLVDHSATTNEAIMERYRSAQVYLEERIEQMEAQASEELKET